MAPVLIENGHPVSRLCRKALIGLGQDPDPNALYLLQLMEWAFGTGEVKDRSGAVEGTLREMRSWEPRSVVEFVAGNNGSRSLPLPRENLAPRELAYYLLLLLQASIAEHHSEHFLP